MCVRGGCIFPQTKVQTAFTSRLAGSPLMFVSCLLVPLPRSKVMILKLPRQRRFSSSVTVNMCSSKHQKHSHLHHVVKTHHRGASATRRAVLSNALQQAATTMTNILSVNFEQKWATVLIRICFFFYLSSKKNCYVILPMPANTCETPTKVWIDSKSTIPFLLIIWLN